jgi:hypothetical protein
VRLGAATSPARDTAAYTRAGNEIGVFVIPGGLAFARSKQQHPELNFYAADRRHPSPIFSSCRGRISPPARCTRRYSRSLLSTCNTRLGSAMPQRSFCSSRLGKRYKIILALRSRPNNRRWPHRMRGVDADFTLPKDTHCSTFAAAMNILCARKCPVDVACNRLALKQRHLVMAHAG